MSEQSESASSRPDRVWRSFNSRGFSIHYAHVQNGFISQARCVVCREGVQGIFKTHAGKISEPSVVQDSGVDEKKTSAPTPDSWWSSPEGP